jgi:hypothetical protein
LTPRLPLEKTMATLANLAKKRKAEARALSAVVDDLVAMAAPAAKLQGIDLEAQLAQAAVRRAEDRQRLAERLRECVAPLFIDYDRGRPERLGSCVLVRLLKIA